MQNNKVKERRTVKYMNDNKKANVAQYQSLELWLNECYGCDRKGKYDCIRQFIINERIPLANFCVKRTILDSKWVEEARRVKNSLGIDLPFVRLTNKKGEVITMNFAQWKQAYWEATGKLEPKSELMEKKPKQKRKVKTTNIKRKQTKNTKMTNEEEV